MIQIPTWAQLYAAILSDLETEFGTSIPTFGKSFLRILAAVLASQLKVVYLVLGFLQKNTFADTADPESLGGTLERFGRVFLGRDPFAATAGQYTVTVTGQVGAVIIANTTFKSDDSATSPGVLFILDTQLTFSAATETITIRATEVGLDSRLSINDTLTLTAPIANVEDSATVTAETVIPLAAEDIEDYRTLVLQAVRVEPQGGAAADYRLWGSEVQGVQQIYPYAVSAADATVIIYVEATVSASTDGKGTPTAAILTDVENAIEQSTVNTPARKPITVIPTYSAISPLDVDIEIADFVDHTAAKETAITEAITTELSNIRPFIPAISVQSEKNDIFDTNKIISLISAAVPGSVFGAVTMTVGGNAVTTFSFQDGDIPFLNNIDFI